MRVLLFVLVLLCGCATPMNNLVDLIETKHIEKQHLTVDATKEYYFTKEAQEFIKDIPCVDGFTVSGSYVVGVNFWSTIAGVLSGSGYSRKCVISKRSLRNIGPEAIIHEYIHHIDDISRDDDLNLINIDDFRRAYIRMASDSMWAGLVIYAERRANKFITDVFGIGDLSERIAYVGGRMAKQQSGPKYMWTVFERILKRHERKGGTRCKGMDTEH